MGRGNKAGSGVEKRPKSIRIVFNYQGGQVKETLFVSGVPMAPTPANIAYATRMAAEIRNKIEMGNGLFKYADYFPNSPRATKTDKLLTAKLLDNWYALLELKPSTLLCYRRAKDAFWKPAIGHIPVPDVKHSDILKALKSGNWKSAKTRNNKLSMIRSAFDLAVADEVIATSPCDAIENQTYQIPKPDPFSLDEAKAIVADMIAHYPEQVGNYCQAMFFSGLRTSEGMGLDWPQVGMANRTALIDRGFVVDEMTEDTKTGKARLIQLNSLAFEAVDRQRKWTFLKPVDADGRHAVFNDPGTEKPWAYEQNFRKRYWTPTLKRLGIRYRRPYNMRHTYATIGLMSGANPGMLAKQLGHSLKMFFEVYADWIDGADTAREMDKIEAKLHQVNPELSPAKSGTA
jgi:integrase